MPAVDFDHVIDVNIKGVANVVRHFVPAMIEKRNGVIVNFSSGWGRSTAPGCAPDCASKWAIEGLTQALAQELPAGMAAVPLNPDIIDTDMLRTCFGAEAGQYPNAAKWAKQVGPFLLQLGAKDNGQPLSALPECAAELIPCSLLARYPLSSTHDPSSHREKSHASGSRLLRGLHRPVWFS